ncbi:MAG: PrsW family intramembrane metalloprotease [Eubacterium sp.]|nr:PrsW family intramembrane metalloprotease [Eubacterium sp.]
MGGNYSITDNYWIMIAVAIIPPLLLMIFIYRRDKHEREPKGLLFKCAALGALSVITALIGEAATMGIIESVFSGKSIYLYYFVEAFFGVAIVEEAGKFLMLRLGTWKNRHFDYTFDGIIYSVFVSLGFALVENILYVIQNGFSTGLFRAVTAIPGHAAFGVYMGYYYGLAKFWEVAGDKKKCRRNLWAGWLIATILHGFYDFCALSGKPALMILFLVFIVAMDIAVIVQVIKSSKNDTPIYRTYQRPMYQMSFQQAYQNPYGTQQPQYLQYQYGNPYGGQVANPGMMNRPPYGGQMPPGQMNRGPVNQPPYGRQMNPGPGNRLPYGAEIPPGQMYSGGMNAGLQNKGPVNPNPYAGATGVSSKYTGGEAYRESESNTDKLTGGQNSDRWE